MSSEPPSFGQAPESPSSAPPEPPKRRSKWRMVAIVVLGAIAALFVAGIIIGALTDAERDESGSVSEGGSLSIFDVKPGDCLNGVEETDQARSIEAVPCSRRHQGEAYANFDLPDGDWPGLDAVTADSDRLCGRELPRRSRSAAKDRNVEVFYFHPTENSWETRDDRTVICLVRFRQPRTGRLVPARR